MFFKKNRIKEEYENRFQYSPDFHYTEEMELILNDHPEELYNLIELFEKEDFIEDKLFLTALLIKFNYLQVKEFLSEFLQDKDRDKWIKPKSETWRHYEIWSACNLIKLKDKFGVDFIRKTAGDVTEMEGRWIAELLVENDNNSMAVELLNELHEKYPLIAKSIDYMKKIYDEDEESSIF